MSDEWAVCVQRSVSVEFVGLTIVYWFLGFLSLAKYKWLFKDFYLLHDTSGWFKGLLLAAVAAGDVL